MEQWKTGDVITAERLNGMTAPFIVNLSVQGSTAVLDKTWNEIHNAFKSGIPVLVHDIMKDNGTVNAEGYWIMESVDYMNGDGYTDYRVKTSSGIQLVTRSEDGYPSAGTGM